MTDAQLSLLISAITAGLAGLGIVIRWAVNRITKSIDDNAATFKEQAKANTDLAKELAILSTKSDAVASWVVSASGVLERWTVPTVQPKRLPTPPPEEQEDDYEPPKKKGGTPIRGIPIIEPPMMGGGYSQPRKPKKNESPEE